VRQFAKPFGVSGDDDPTVGQVEIVQGEASDGRSASGMDGGQGGVREPCSGRSDASSAGQREPTSDTAHLAPGGAAET
jgi:hypothetical protein